MSEFQTAILAGICAAAFLIIEHLLFWRHPFRLWPPAAYIVGTATLATSFTVWCWAWGLEMAAIAFWCIAGIGGGVVVAAWWWREVQSRVAEHNLELGRTLGLEQDIIDGPTGKPGDPTG